MVDVESACGILKNEYARLVRQAQRKRIAIWIVATILAGPALPVLACHWAAEVGDAKASAEHVHTAAAHGHGVHGHEALGHSAPVATGRSIHCRNEPPAVARAAAGSASVRGGHIGAHAANLEGSSTTAGAKKPGCCDDPLDSCCVDSLLRPFAPQPGPEMPVLSIVATIPAPELSVASGPAHVVWELPQARGGSPPTRETIVLRI